MNQQFLSNDLSPEDARILARAAAVGIQIIGRFDADHPELYQRDDETVLAYQGEIKLIKALLRNLDVLFASYDIECGASPDSVNFEQYYQLCQDLALGNKTLPAHLLLQLRHQV